MTAKQKLTTVISARGGITLPRSVREQKRWKPGTRLIVENRSEGVLLRREPLFAPTRLEDVFGCLAYKGKPKTIDEMGFGGASPTSHKRRRKR